MEGCCSSSRRCQVNRDVIGVEVARVGLNQGCGGKVTPAQGQSMGEAVLAHPPAGGEALPRCPGCWHDLEQAIVEGAGTGIQGRIRVGQLRAEGPGSPVGAIDEPGLEASSRFLTAADQYQDTGAAGVSILLLEPCFRTKVARHGAGALPVGACRAWAFPSGLACVALRSPHAQTWPWASAQLQVATVVIPVEQLVFSGMP